MASPVNKGLAPGLPGLSDGPGLSQTHGLWKQFLGLSGISGAAPPPPPPPPPAGQFSFPISLVYMGS